MIVNRSHFLKVGWHGYFSGFRRSEPGDEKEACDLFKLLVFKFVFLFVEFIYKTLHAEYHSKTTLALHLCFNER
ncbi:MAG TPA: hypothetical protein DCR17_03080 [Verrucomicrobiales bacterium]|nr:hypothetical protein [Pedosphaera sp.]HAO65656.1 hypothetical protein [Verrucomicrobiales bacterium]HAQ99592.1 hypothetical protein [Verrucomicrobiales bacterium]HBP57328.1 hypothetical protein [Verrucomicrobiales bacterium]